MTIEQLALRVVQACETAGVEHMVTGAFAFNFYGIPRSTKDFDVVVDVRGRQAIAQIIRLLDDIVEFGDQLQFDTRTWGRRHIGRAKHGPIFQVELFELFDDPFVTEQFRRRLQLRSTQLGYTTWLPTAEDVIVQKIRWGRSKDLDDARDVLAVQDPSTLDMAYVRQWCDTHGTAARLDDILFSLPPL